MILFIVANITVSIITIAVNSLSLQSTPSIMEFMLSNCIYIVTSVSSHVKQVYAVTPV